MASKARQSAARVSLGRLPAAERTNNLEKVNTWSRIVSSRIKVLLEEGGFAERKREGRHVVAWTLQGDPLPFEAGAKAVFPGDSEIVLAALEDSWPNLQAAGCPELPIVHDLTFSVRIVKRKSTKKKKKKTIIKNAPMASWELNAVWPVPALDGEHIFRVYNRSSNRELLSTKRVEVATADDADDAEADNLQPEGTAAAAAAASTPGEAAAAAAVQSPLPRLAPASSPPLLDGSPTPDDGDGILEHLLLSFSNLDRPSEGNLLLDD